MSGPLFWKPTQGRGSSVSGGSSSPQPQITTIDFTVLNGLNFVTGGAGKYFTISGDSNQGFYFWFNVFTETDPSPAGAGIGVEVDILSSASASDIASAVASAGTSTFNTSSSGAVATFVNRNNEVVDSANAKTSGAIITITQSGHS